MATAAVCWRASLGLRAINRLTKSFGSSSTKVTGAVHLQSLYNPLSVSSRRQLASATVEEKHTASELASKVTFEDISRAHYRILSGIKRTVFG